MITYYEILEVSRTASKEVITKAYKVLVRKYHPDLEQDEKKKDEAKEKMVRINEAYETLSDEIKRNKYDKTIAMLEEKERREEEKKKNYQSNQNYSQNINNKNFNMNNVDNIDINRRTSNINNIKQENNGILQEEMLRAEEEIQLHKQNIVNQMYEDYYNALRRMGYKVVTRRPLKERIKTYLITGFVILILVLIYNIPAVRGLIYSKAYGTVFELPVRIFDIILTLPIKMMKS